MKKKFERDEMPRHNYDDEIEDNEVGHSYAYLPGRGPKDESKEVKEFAPKCRELFTGGEWLKIYEDNDIIFESSLEWKTTAICSITGGKDDKEDEANAALIAQSKNMYNILKKIVEWDGDRIYIPHLSEAKEILQKANPSH